MRLDEARDLKRALLSGSVALRVDEGHVPEVTAAGTFVGIVPSADPDGFRLAVRLTRPVGDTAAYAAALTSVVGGEVDVRYVGPVRALAHWPAPDLAREPTGELTAPPDPEPAAERPTPEQLQQRVRPLVRGSSVAHRDVSAGTVGAFVALPGSSAVHVLSNNHVLADSDRGQPGDDVLQPGPADGGSVDDRVGALLAAVRLEPGVPNLVDAALAVVDPEIEVDTAAHDGAITGVRDAYDVVGEVAKIGRTTGFTVGRISAIEVDGVPVGYDTGVLVFDDQVEIEGADGGFSAGGDSGSVIYTLAERAGVGLLFAGSTTGGPGGAGVTYANSLATVLAALGATLLP